MRQLDTEIAAGYPERWGSKVTIVLKNGETIEKQTDYPKGDPENPVTSEDLQHKFFVLATVLPEGKRNAFSGKVLELEEMENVAELMAQL